MTADEIKICRAFSGVVFVPGSRTKRLALDLARDAEINPTYALSERQRAVVLSIAIRYRRQLPGEIVDLAKTLKGAAAA